MPAGLSNIITALKKMTHLEKSFVFGGADLFYQLEHFEALDYARAHYFHDTRSRMVFDWVMQQRIVGSFHDYPIPVALDNAPYSAEQWAELERQAEKLDTFAQGDYLLDRIDCWLLECYSLPGVCEVGSGDIVFDCGAYTGNTSLYFSRKTGPAGHVFGFEPGPQTFPVYAGNMQGLDNVTAIPAAVGKICGQANFSGSGRGSHFGGHGDIVVPVTTLDAFFEQHSLARVDFIKMDIEGAEAAALSGARNIIAKHKPAMAISAYHKKEDLPGLADLILDICPTYKFSLRHFSLREWETVLYCYQDPGRPDIMPYKDASPRAKPANAKTYKELLHLLLPYLKRQMHKNMLAQNAAQNKVLEEARTMLPEIQQLLELSDNVAKLSRRNEELAAENMVLKKMLTRRGA